MPAHSLQSLPGLADRELGTAQLLGEASLLHLIVAHLGRDPLDLGLHCLQPGFGLLRIARRAGRRGRRGGRRGRLRVAMRTSRRWREGRYQQPKRHEHASPLGDRIGMGDSVGGFTADSTAHTLAEPRIRIGQSHRDAIMRNFLATWHMDRLIEYFGHHALLASAAVALAIVVAAYETRMRGHNIAAISPQDVIRLMNQGALLIDLRPQEQFAAGHVSGARQMTGEQILKGTETLKKYREKFVVIYDDTGTLSASARRQLANQGFTKAFNLRGGLAAWRSENLPLTKGQGA